jgi:hypothetical protein
MSPLAALLTGVVRHLLDWFRALRRDLAFGLGCTALHHRLSAVGLPTCYPEPAAADDPAWSERRIYDPCLALRLGGSGSVVAAI